MGTETMAMNGPLEEALNPVSENVSDCDMEFSEDIPHWKDQITLRGFVVGALLGILFCIMVHRLILATGITPPVNMAASFLGFFIIKMWTAFLSNSGFSTTPFTKQENTVIQTCVVACYGIAVSAGFGSYLLAMDEKTYKLIGVDYPGNRAEDIKNPSLGWMISLLFVVSFLGIFGLAALRKVMIIDFKLIYPSGTATATFINSVHTNGGADLAGKQVSCLGKYLSLSFCWSCFKWFFSGVENSCGFDNFPIFGLKLLKQTFYFDFNPCYVGIGLLCPQIVICSILLGAIIFRGFLLPFIFNRAGHWYPSNLSDSDLRGRGGYETVVAISLILGDSLYGLIKIIAISLKKLNESTKKDYFLISGEILDAKQKLRNKIFLQESIPSWFAACGYITLAIIAAVALPIIFPPLKWYIVLISCVIAPVLAFCNSYSVGLTDMNMCSIYGKICLFIVAAFVGRNGGVIAGLAACGIMVTIISTSAELMQDFRTCYLTLSSSRSMFVSQLVGTAMGCVIAPLTFWLYWMAFDIGSPYDLYKAPFAIVYREMAIIGVEGLSALPMYSISMFCSLFAVAVVINIMRDVTPPKLSRYLPIPTALVIPVFAGANLAVDMFIGTVIAFLWKRRNQKDAEDYAMVVASGLICGDGLWTIPSAVLSILRINPPICMYFAPSSSV